MSARPLVALATLLCAGLILRADEPKLPDVKEYDKLVVASLRDVHNRGADLYNEKKEFAGTYRMYEGALVALRPLLAHRPKAQKLIDDGIAAAGKETNTAQKAFRLHEAIEAVRAHLKEVEVTKKPEEKGSVDKTLVDKKSSVELAPPPREKKL